MYTSSDVIFSYFHTGLAKLSIIAKKAEPTIMNIFKTKL